MQGTYIVQVRRQVQSLQEAEDLARRWAGQLGEQVVVRVPRWRCFPLTPVLGLFGPDR